jgi:hypothetical protein
MRYVGSSPVHTSNSLGLFNGHPTVLPTSTILENCYYFLQKFLHMHVIIYIQRRSTALLILGCYWPCRNPCLFEVELQRQTFCRCTFTHSNVCEILVHANRQERFFPTSARRRIAPDDQIFIIISPLIIRR